MNIGKKIKELRKQRGITQEQLAESIGISFQAVSKWETGSSVPDVETMVKISELYGITVNDIVHADLTKIKYQKEIVIPDKEKMSQKIFVIGCGRWGSFRS